MSEPRPNRRGRNRTIRSWCRSGSPRQPAAAVSCDPPSESPRRSSPLFPPPDHQVPDFGHVLDGEADAFAAEPRILDAAIGHVVDAVAGHVVDDDAADFEPIPRSEEHTSELQSL